MKISFFGGRWMRALSLGISLTLVFMIALPTAALAYFSYPGCSISFGSGSVTVVKGSTTSVVCTVSPMSEQQLPGCGMSICPQECGSLTTPGGVVGGCLNGEGWCTCAGTTYQTYNTQVSVSSSNPSVARATFSGGALSIKAYGVGTTTVTVTASLSKHVDSSNSMTVTVTEASSDPEQPSDPEGPPADVDPGDTPSSDGSGVSVSASGVATAVAGSSQAAEQTVVIEGEDGTKIILVPATYGADGAEALAEVAGTNGRVTFWVGDDPQAPILSWTFLGTDLDPAGDLSMKLGASVSKTGTGDVAELLADAGDSLVIDFENEGPLPASMEVYVRTDGTYSDGTVLSLFFYNEDGKVFEKVQEGITATDSYASFKIDHTSTYALSTDDLSAYALSTEEEQASGDEGIEIVEQPVTTQADATPYVIAGIAAVVAVFGIVMALMIRRQRRNAAELAAVPAGVDGSLEWGGKDGGDAGEVVEAAESAVKE